MDKAYTWPCQGVEVDVVGINEKTYTVLKGKQKAEAPSLVVSSSRHIKSESSKPQGSVLIVCK